VPQANLFIGGVCHGNDKVKVFQELNALIRIELSGLTQTAHILRSPNNAKRLMATVARSHRALREAGP
jgi:hypothetical protein